MPRGGYRKGAGLKPSWKHGKTKVIRVPEALAEQIIEYARKLDNRESDSVTEKQSISVTESKTIDLSGMPIHSSNKGSVVYLADLIHFGYQIKPDRLHDSIKKKNRLIQQTRLNQLKLEIDKEIEKLDNFDE